MKIKKGDTVTVIAGNDKGKKGEVTRVLSDKNQVVVRGVNIVKKHQKKTQARVRNQQTGIIEVEMPINASNVMLMQDGKPVRANKRKAE
jgi:large subunit ribosomal protein L24